MSHHMTTKPHNGKLLWLIIWFYPYFIVCQCGSCHMRTFLQTSYRHPNLCIHIEWFACDKCQQAKITSLRNRLLLDHDIAGAPLEEVADDLVGPWSVTTLHGNIQFYVLTWNGATTNIVKSQESLKKPKSMQVIHDSVRLQVWLVNPVESVECKVDSNYL